MITKPQQKWLGHLNTKDKIIIKPYDPKSSEIFEEVKKRIISEIGKTEVLHRGASYLQISGQNEIDVYIPITPNEFNKMVGKMAKSFGEPRSLYPLAKGRFILNGFGKQTVKSTDKHIEVYVMNNKDSGWIDSETFTNWLLTHPRTLEEYKNLKEKCMGLSTKEYYTRKLKFINEVLKKAKKLNA